MKRPAEFDHLGRRVVCKLPGCARAVWFEVGRVGRRLEFCSGDCRRTARKVSQEEDRLFRLERARAERAARPPEPCRRPGCGRIPAPSRGRRRVFCSARCRDAFNGPAKHRRETERRRASRGGQAA